MTGFVEIPTLEQYCSYCGQRCLHPDIGIITSGGLPDGQAFKGNFYAICFRRTWCGDKRYGCGCYDFTSATVVFKSPGEIIEPAPVGNCLKYRRPVSFLRPDYWLILRSATNGTNIHSSVITRMSLCICHGGNCRLLPEMWRLLWLSYSGRRTAILRSFSASISAYCSIIVSAVTDGNSSYGGTCKSGLWQSPGYWQKNILCRNMPVNPSGKQQNIFVENFPSRHSI